MVERREQTGAIPNPNAWIREHVLKLATDEQGNALPVTEIARTLLMNPSTLRSIFSGKSRLSPRVYETLMSAFPAASSEDREKLDEMFLRRRESADRARSLPLRMAMENMSPTPQAANSDILNELIAHGATSIDEMAKVLKVSRLLAVHLWQGHSDLTQRQRKRAQEWIESRSDTPNA